jgi:hypothetical protein
MAKVKSSLLSETTAAHDSVQNMRSELQRNRGYGSGRWKLAFIARAGDGVGIPRAVAGGARVRGVARADGAIAAHRGRQILVLAGTADQGSARHPVPVEAGIARTRDCVGGAASGAVSRRSRVGGAHLTGMACLPVAVVTCQRLKKRVGFDERKVEQDSREYLSRRMLWRSVQCPIRF